MTQAEDAVGQLNDIGASSAHVASVQTTTKPFDYESMTFGDAMPTIHVGFVTHKTITADNDGEDAGGLTSKMYMAGCSPTVTIEFPIDKGTTWSFSSPFAKEMTDAGARYYDAGDMAPGKIDLRHVVPALVTARGAARVRPQPHQHRLRDDEPPRRRRRSRGATARTPTRSARFPTTSGCCGPPTRRAARAGTSTRSTRGTASRRPRRAAPPTRSSSARRASAPRSCIRRSRTARAARRPDGGSTSACPGDTLYTRYALNNYSTGSVRVTSTLSLSSDETSDATDTLSTTTRTDDLSATTSKLVEAKWKVPSVSGATVYKVKNLHPIVHLLSEHINADGSADPNSLRIAWMPLRGTIDVSQPCSTAGAAGRPGRPPL